MKTSLIWIDRNKRIYLKLSMNQRINLKNKAGVSLWWLMFQHPDILLSRIKRLNHDKT